MNRENLQPVPSSRGLRDQESCEATFDAQTGWSKTFLTTPSAPSEDAFGDIF
jgi:hypothetical protein